MSIYSPGSDQAYPLQRGSYLEGYLGPMPTKSLSGRIFDSAKSALDSLKNSLSRLKNYQSLKDYELITYKTLF